MKRLLLVLALLSAPCFATQTPVQNTAAANGGSGTTVNATLTAESAGNFNFVAVTLCNDSICSSHYLDTVSVSDGVNTYQQVSCTTDASTHVDVRIFYAENISAGTRTVTATSGSTSWYLTVLPSEWSGVATSGSFDVCGAVVNGNSANPSGVVTNSATTANNDLVIAIVADDNVPTFNAPYTSLTTQGGDNVQYQIGAAQSTYTATWTAASGGWDAVIATFKAPAAAGSGATITGTAKITGTVVVK